MNLNFRTLKASEIECRIGQIKYDKSEKPTGLTLLLYKDARCDMTLLDETVGAMNWKRAHTRDNANCIVSIYDTDKHEWVSKEDTGTESNTEAEKGLASDSFKRACVNWGIGRELYTSPFIWIPSDLCNIRDRKCFDRFSVQKIDYNSNREISALQIVNDKTGVCVFAIGERITPKSEPKAENLPVIEDGEVISGVPCCEDCGTPFPETQDPKTGKHLSPADCKELAIKLRGAAVCAKCAAKRKLAAHK